MDLPTVLESICCDQFVAEMNVSNDWRQFVELLQKQIEVELLRQLIRSSSTAPIDVIKAMQALVHEHPERFYQHPHDATLAVLQWALVQEYPWLIFYTNNLLGLVKNPCWVNRSNSALLRQYAPKQSYAEDLEVIVQLIHLASRTLKEFTLDELYQFIYAVCGGRELGMQDRDVGIVFSYMGSWFHKLERKYHLSRERYGSTNGIV